MTLLPLHRETDGPHAGIVTLTLEQRNSDGTLRPVVVLDHDLMIRLDATLDAVPGDARGLVLASAAPRAFVAGADLKAVANLDDEHLHRYLELGARVFARLCACPFPTAAAINAAALGGGLEIAMHCDGLIGATPVAAADRPAKPYPVGLPEAGLGICPGWGGTNLLPARLDPATAITMTAEGKPTTSDKATGLFDAVASEGKSVIDAAKRWLTTQRITRGDRDGAPRMWIGRPAIAAKVLSSLDSIRGRLADTEAARAVAEAVEVGLSRGWQAAIACEREHLVRLRHTPRAKEAIAAFFARSGG